MDTISTGHDELKLAKCSCNGIGKLPNGSECICRKKARVEAYKDYASVPRGFNYPSWCWKECKKVLMGKMEFAHTVGDDIGVVGFEMDEVKINYLLKYAEDIENRIRNGEGVFIHGEPTSGKTFVAVALAKLAIGKDFRVKYYSVVEYLDIMRNRIGDDIPYQDLRYNMEVMDIIIWDRLQDIQSNIGWERSDITSSIRLRFDKGYADIVVTDQKPDGFKTDFGDSLYNYLVNNCINIHTRVWEEEVGD